MKNKRGIVPQELLYAIIAVAVLIFGLLAYSIITGKTESALDFFENLWRFGR
ncbi:hypothetical protein HYV50_01095 [Candidatus Pacearchaeota archaeon]|nr:hypothetical protein [Candidatus Pacearchaeota archaeon]